MREATEAVRGHEEDIKKMAIKPKVILGFLLLTLAIFLVIFSISNLKNKSSQLTVFPQGNQFQLEFYVLPKDADKLERTLNRLGLPKLNRSLSFELDGTSQAKLASVAPLKVNLEFLQNSIEFNGTYSRPAPFLESSNQKLKIPKSTNIAIAARSIGNLLTSKLDFPPILIEWIDNNQENQTLQYFYNFDQNQNVLIFKSQKPLEDLKNFLPETVSYKEDSQENTKYIFLTYTSLKDLKEKTLSIVTLEDLVYITPSLETAKAILEFQKNPKDAIEFPQNSYRKTIYSFYLKNNSDDFSNLLTDLVLTANPQAVTFTKNIDSFYLSLSQKEFSGLINFRGN